MAWSLSGFDLSSPSMIFLIDCFTLSEAMSSSSPSAGALDARVEEVLQLEEPLRRVHVLVGGDPADGRLVHADGLGHIAQDHRLQEGVALLEEVALLVDDALGDADDRLSPLLDGADQPLRVAQLLADEVLGVGILEELFLVSCSLMYSRCTPRSLSVTVNLSPSFTT